MFPPLLATSSAICKVIDSTFVSTVGQKSWNLNSKWRRTGVAHAVAMVNGTAALHIALLCAGVKPNTEVITQPLSFVATTNAIAYTRAQPVFVDVQPDITWRWLEQWHRAC